MLNWASKQMQAKNTSAQADLSRVMAIVAIACLTCSCSVNGQTAPTEAVAMEQCSVKQGADKSGKFTISLERSGATGFQWFISLPSNQKVRLLQEGEQASKSENGAVGTAVKQWWNLQLVDSKVADIDFYLYRSWEGKERAAKHCVAHVAVE